MRLNSLTKSLFMRMIVLLTSSAAITGCSATSVYTKAAKLGVQIVGDSIAEDEVKKEAAGIMGKDAAAADARFGKPRGVFLDTASRREIRVYNHEKDILGKKRWVVEIAGGRIDGLSQAEENPDLGTDKAKAVMLEETLRGKTPAEVRATPVADKLVFQSDPHKLQRVPGGELVQIYNVTSFLDVVGSRFLVLGYDANGRCAEVRFVGTPGK